nr:PREDICTED: uncharacterized protein LOC105661874 [Megachile rotundata]
MCVSDTSSCRWKTFLNDTIADRIPPDRPDFIEIQRSNESDSRSELFLGSKNDTDRGGPVARKKLAISYGPWIEKEEIIVVAGLRQSDPLRGLKLPTSNAIHVCQLSRGWSTRTVHWIFRYKHTHTCRCRRDHYGTRAGLTGFQGESHFSSCAAQRTFYRGQGLRLLDTTLIGIDYQQTEKKNNGETSTIGGKCIDKNPV